MSTWRDTATSSSLWQSEETVGGWQAQLWAEGGLRAGRRGLAGSSEEVALESCGRKASFLAGTRVTRRDSHTWPPIPTCCPLMGPRSDRKGRILQPAP